MSMNGTKATSLKRRHLMIAGAAAAALPAGVWAQACTPRVAGMSRKPTVTEIATDTTAEKLIVSGRVVGADCRPLPGALVELWGAESDVSARATTDADGRFVLVSAVPARGAVHLRISHNGKVILTRRRLSGDAASDEIAHVYRDESRVWRTTLGVTFA